MGKVRSKEAGRGERHGREWDTEEGGGGLGCLHVTTQIQRPGESAFIRGVPDA